MLQFKVRLIQVYKTQEISIEMGDQECPTCQELYSDDYPKVSLNGCQCIVCIYCAFAIICKARCYVCGNTSSNYFTFCDVQISDAQILERKNEFIRDYNNLRANNPNIPELDLSNLQN